MAEYIHKTISGCERRIEIVKGRISFMKEKRGIGPGTFYFDLAAVDESIANGFAQIEKFKFRIKEIKRLKVFDLYKELMKSEIF